MNMSDLIIDVTARDNPSRTSEPVNFRFPAVSVRVEWTNER